MLRHGDDHYRTLGVPVGASDEQIRAAYRGLARHLHPDVAADTAGRRRAESAMAEVNEAWMVLGDRYRRAAYDLVRRPAEPVASPSPVDEAVHGRQGDSFQAVPVPAAVGCLLQFGPVVLIVGLLVGILVATAVFIGLAAEPIYDIAFHAGQQLIDPTAYIEAVNPLRIAAAANGSTAG